MFPALYTVAPLAELVDARDSKSRSREGVPVRFRRGAPLFFIFFIRHPGTGRDPVAQNILKHSQNRWIELDFGLRQNDGGRR